MQINKLLATFSLMFFCAKFCHAQVGVTNNGILYIASSSDILHVNGSFTNNATAALTNSGNLYVSATLTNHQPAMAIGSGTLYLNGSTAQTIDGTQPLKTNNLVTNNAAGITLNANLTISGVHTFTNGLIASSATPNYLVYEAGSSHSGSIDARHSTGWVKKNGNTAFTFPVGNGTYLRTIGIGTLSAVSEFNCRYLAPTQNLYNLSPPVVKVKANEFWQLDRVSGGTAQVLMNWDHSKIVMDDVLLIDILAANYAGATWINVGDSNATGSTTATGNVSSDVINSFGQFTIGYRSFPVPVKLLSFTAQRRNHISALKWITDNEQSVSHFEVLRSYDARNFSKIGTIAARNSGNTETYLFEDSAPLNGFAWYRIRSVDMDGKTSLSNINVVSEIDAKNGNFLVLNPAKNAITIMNQTGEDGLVQYQLYTYSGQPILSGNINMNTNSAAAIQLPGHIATGIYLLELKNHRTQSTQKILIER